MGKKCYLENALSNKEPMADTPVFTYQRKKRGIRHLFSDGQPERNMMTSDPSIENSLPPISERGLTDDEVAILLDKIAAIHRSAEMLTKAFRTDDAPSSELPIPSVSSAVFYRRPLQHRQDIHDRHDHLSPIMKQLDAFANHLIQELIEGTTEGYLAIFHDTDASQRQVVPLSRHYPQYYPDLGTQFRIHGKDEDGRCAKISRPHDKSFLLYVGDQAPLFDLLRVRIAFFLRRKDGEQWIAQLSGRAAND